MTQPSIDLNDKIYLSIDLDFWTGKEAAIKGISETLKYADAHNIPLNVVMNHQQLLPFTNHSEARTLVNLDQHSDARDERVDRFDCGSWISYVKWRKEGNYLWARNSPSVSLGNCNHRFLADWNKNIGWKSTSSNWLQQSFDILDLLKKAVDIGICLSPGFTYRTVYDAVRPLLKGRPYRPGWVRENDKFKLIKPPVAIQTIQENV